MCVCCTNDSRCATISSEFLLRDLPPSRSMPLSSHPQYSTNEWNGNTKGPNSGYNAMLTSIRRQVNHGVDMLTRLCCQSGSTMLFHFISFR